MTIPINGADMWRDSVIGGRDDILSAVDRFKIEKIVLAVPSASAQEKRDILNICKETGCELKNLPGIYQFLTGEVRVSALKTFMGIID